MQAARNAAHRPKVPPPTVLEAKLFPTIKLETKSTIPEVEGLPEALPDPVELDPIHQHTSSKMGKAPFVNPV
jgi:hypothetical protein